MGTETDSFEYDLERRLYELADTVNEDDARRVVGRVDATERRRRWRRNGLAFCAGIAAVAVSAATLTSAGVFDGNTNPTNPTSSGGPHISVARDPALSDNVEAFELSGGLGKPCSDAIHAKHVAQLRTSTPVWTPRPGAVAGARMRDAWTCSGLPVVMYGPIQVTYESGWRNIPVPKKWHDMADEWGGYVGTVLDRPAWIAPGETNPRRERVPDSSGGYEYRFGTSNHSVMVVVDGVAIEAVAPDHVGIDKVVDLVDSMQPPTPFLGPLHKPRSPREGPVLPKGQ